MEHMILFITALQNLESKEKEVFALQKSPFYGVIFM